MTNLEIEAFLAIARTGSITRAARSLFITQPALSRRIKALEAELGCSLVDRQKGMRKAELTKEGRAFTSVAERWQLLWREAKEIAGLSEKTPLNVSAVDSVSTYIMSSVYRAFLQENPGTNLSIRTLHAYEAYAYVEGGFVDIAFVSDDIYAEGAEMTPALQESMLFVCGADAPYGDPVHPTQLDPSRQIRIPWNMAYDVWHKHWFRKDCHPRVFLDKMSLLEEFLCWEDNWAVVPASVAFKLKEKTSGTAIRGIEEGPPDRIIYYLLGRYRNALRVADFLSCMRARLSALDYITLLF